LNFGIFTTIEIKFILKPTKKKLAQTNHPSMIAVHS